MIEGAQAAIYRRFFEYCLNPFSWLFLILLLVVLYLLWPHRSRRAKRVGWVCLAAWLLLFITSTPWLPNRMIRGLEQQYHRIHEVDAGVHWVVVLGGGVTENLKISASDALTASSLKRLFEGVRLYRALPEARLVLSGGSPRQRTPAYSTAARYASLAEIMHVSAQQRMLAPESMNTADEALFSKQTLGDARFYLVTSALHMPRAMKLFEAEGLHPIPAPCNYLSVERERQALWLDSFPSVYYLVRFNAAWHEYLGLLWGDLKRVMLHDVAGNIH